MGDTCGRETVRRAVNSMHQDPSYPWHLRAAVDAAILSLAEGRAPHPAAKKYNLGSRRSHVKRGEIGRLGLCDRYARVIANGADTCRGCPEQNRSALLPPHARITSRRQALPEDPIDNE